MNKKKIIITMIIVIVIIAIAIGTIIIVNKTNNKEQQMQIQNTKISKLYNKILETKEITFTKKLDDNNKITVAIKDNKAYKEVTSNGRTKKYIVKDSDTYYLDASDKIYYKYQSNDSILTEVKEQFEPIYDKGVITGKEKINGKTYSYEEISRYQGFLYDDELSVNNLDYAKTRLYFDNNELIYIKTIVGDNEEIIKVDISYKDIDDDYFTIPEDYSDGSEI